MSARPRTMETKEIQREYEEEYGSIILLLFIASIYHGIWELGVQQVDNSTLN